jgi:hypothetical protein
MAGTRVATLMPVRLGHGNNRRFGATDVGEAVAVSGRLACTKENLSLIWSFVKWIKPSLSCPWWHRLNFSADIDQMNDSGQLLRLMNSKSTEGASSNPPQLTRAKTVSDCNVIDGCLLVPKVERNCQAVASSHVTRSDKQLLGLSKKNVELFLLDFA